jgi:uncharacterized protein YdhG (YjbR/CyaY superfamily)
MTVDEYLGGAPEPHRSTLAALRKTLRDILPDADESLSYGVPAFKVDGKAVAGYAYHKNHCGYYPHSESVLAALGDELDGYEWSRGTLRFPTDTPLPKPLVQRLIEIRLAEIES